MTETQREFKGVWIPKQIWLDERLSALEKVILAEIDSLDCTEVGCRAGNEYIAGFCQCSEKSVTRALSKLAQLGYIDTESFNGRMRVIRIRVDKMSRQGGQNVQAGWTKCPGTNNIINTSINTSINKPPISPKGDDGFERFWAVYPKKTGKVACLSKWEKLKPNAELTEKIIKAVETQKQWKAWTKDKGQYIPNPLTWLNQGRWDDEQVQEKSNPTEYTEFWGNEA